MSGPLSPSSLPSPSSAHAEESWEAGSSSASPAQPGPRSPAPLAWASCTWLSCSGLRTSASPHGVLEVPSRPSAWQYLCDLAAVTSLNLPPHRPPPCAPAPPMLVLLSLCIRAPSWGHLPFAASIPPLAAEQPNPPSSASSRSAVLLPQQLHHFIEAPAQWGTGPALSRDSHANPAWRCVSICHCSSAPA